MKNHFEILPRFHLLKNFLTHHHSSTNKPVGEAEQLALAIKEFEVFIMNIIEEMKASLGTIQANVGPASKIVELEKEVTDLTAKLGAVVPSDQVIAQKVSEATANMVAVTDLQPINEAMKALAVSVTPPAPAPAAA
jgi:hypothetical protein